MSDAQDRLVRVGALIASGNSKHLRHMEIEDACRLGIEEIKRLREALLKVQELCGTVEVADYMALAEVSARCWSIAKEALGDE
jgi:hypothetical protein